jgi:hypothetical protein
MVEPANDRRLPADARVFQQNRPKAAIQIPLKLPFPPIAQKLRCR